MAVCKKIKRQEKRVCSGSLNRRIIIYVRSITAPLAESVDYGENLTQPITTWAMIETVNGVTTFDNSNIERIITHNIYIRYRPDITFENWLEVPRSGALLWNRRANLLLENGRYFLLENGGKILLEGFDPFPRQSLFYDIIRVENLDENYRFYKLICNLRGDTLKPVNLK